MSHRLRRILVASPVFCLAAHGEHPDDGRLDAIFTAWTGAEVDCDVVYTHSADDGPVVRETYSVREGWRLVSVNNARPTPEELDAYGSDANRQLRERRSAPGFKLGEYVDRESARIESEDDEVLTIVYSPRPTDESEDVLLQKMGAKMRGRLQVAKTDLQPLRMEIQLTEPVAVAVPPVRVAEYREARSFVVDPATGALLVETFRLFSRGRAFYVRKVGNSFTRRFSYSGCHFVGAAAGSSQILSPSTPAGASTQAASRRPRTDGNEGFHDLRRNPLSRPHVTNH